MSETPLTVGVLGGMSSQSTIEYYRLLDEGINDALGGHHAAEIAIRSVDFGEIERFIREDRWDEAGAFLADAARDIEAAGADFVVMATNTMHRVAPAIEDALSVPFVHIVDATADAIDDAGVDTVGVLGTAAVMEGDFYAERFGDRGIDVIVPDNEDRTLVDDVIFEELTAGVIRDESREAYLRVIDDLVEAGAEAVVLGCTEIDLLVDQSDRPDVPLFDTTALHAERAVEYSLQGVR
ncbi:aspartate/glutamate racemase family protein [Halobaculum rubrum]|uniref:aspartate/glutamate racemase family protein n=1 Tax=Halobaculum rubrum TaxID=2872158 RepID=UPI001CA3DF00|nr:aspartate/glutamate racemase family protein [Halobaculum rubrum]QZX99143.1 aspartate/glutamate racemase family protein [Halobaculum rubrum]